jgi:hypothetical protein
MSRIFSSNNSSNVSVEVSDTSNSLNARFNFTTPITVSLSSNNTVIGSCNVDNFVYSSNNELAWRTCASNTKVYLNQKLYFDYNTSFSFTDSNGFISYTGTTNSNVSTISVDDILYDTIDTYWNDTQFMGDVRFSANVFIPSIMSSNVAVNNNTIVFNSNATSNAIYSSNSITVLNNTPFSISNCAVFLNSNLGINTTTPTQQFQVVGNIQCGDGVGAYTARMNVRSSNEDHYSLLRTGVGNALFVMNSNADVAFHLSKGASSTSNQLLLQATTGRVGMNYSSPATTLHVGGQGTFESTSNNVILRNGQSNFNSNSSSGLLFQGTLSNNAVINTASIRVQPSNNDWLSPEIVLSFATLGSSNLVDRIKINQYGGISMGYIGNPSSPQQLNLTSFAQFETDGGIFMNSNASIHFGKNIGGKESNAGIVAYQRFSGVCLDVIGAGSNTTTRSVRIYDRIGINSNPATTLDASGTIRATNITDPLTGVGIEMSYDGTNGYLTSYDRGSNTWKPTVLRGSNICFQTQGQNNAIVSASGAIGCLRSIQLNGGALGDNTKCAYQFDNNPSQSNLVLFFKADQTSSTSSNLLTVSSNGQMWLERNTLTLQAANFGNEPFRCNFGSNGAFVIQADRNVVIYNGSGASIWSTNTSTSDRRLKTNIVALDNCLSNVCALKPCAYTFNEKDKMGLIAQDVLEVVPKAVTLMPNEKFIGTTVNEENGTYGIDYNAIVSQLVGAIKELSSKVDALERKN